MIKRFIETGSVKNCTIPERQLKKKHWILHNPLLNQRLFIHKVAQQHDTSRISVQRILKWIKFYLYKIYLVQELNADDFNRRNEFCEFMMQRIDKKLNFIFNSFSDEATFEVNSNVNRYNYRLWFEKNSYYCKHIHNIKKN